MFWLSWQRITVLLLINAMNTDTPTSAKGHAIQRKLDRCVDKLEQLRREEAKIRDAWHSIKANIKTVVAKRKQLERDLKSQAYKDKVRGPLVHFEGFWGDMVNNGFTAQECAALQLQSYKKELGKTDEWIGIHMGVSPQRARQIRTRATGKLYSPKHIRRSIDRGLVPMSDRAIAALAGAKRQEYFAKRLAVFRKTGKLLPLEKDYA